nr:MAG TPA: hypothetical protein [Crassvirales sp.]
MTQDPSSFYDAIAPDPLSPEYAGWARRQLERNGGKNQASQNPATAMANQAANKFFEFENQKIKDAKKHESTLDKLNRRLFENRTFGKLNGDKALTDKEY